jgi:hypothetical protein
VQHTGHAHVVDVNEFAGRFRRQVDARHRLTDDPVLARLLHQRLVGKLNMDHLVADQLAIADAAIILTADQAVLDPELFWRQLEPLRGAGNEKLPCLCCGLAQRHRRDLDGLARDRRALVRDVRGVAEHDDDARKGDVELFGDDLSKRGADAGAEIDMAVIGIDLAGGGDPDEGLEAA